MDYGGTFDQLESVSQCLTVVAPFALLVILGNLAIAFCSVKDGLIIFSGVPLALTGGILLLYLRGVPLSISAESDLLRVARCGDVKCTCRALFYSPALARTGEFIKPIIDGAMVRLRTVLMTALMASLGFIPMALNAGTGAEVQRTLATV